MTILTINTGSSSVRLALFTGKTTPLRLLAQQRIANTDAPEAALRAFIATHEVNSVVHRIVHGGSKLLAPCVVDAEVIAEIEALAALAPLHNPRALTWLRASAKVAVSAVQMAAFDTAFFAQLPAPAREYALPAKWVKRYGLRRYGFHGLAHASLWRRCQQLQIKRSRVITLQLGSGCSIAALRDGTALDTSMGFTPLEGLMMATRSGDVDPGLLLYLADQAALTPAQLEQLLNKESGLLGVAGESDMQRLLVRDDAPAVLAIDMYCARVRKYIGAYCAVLGGVDAIVFSGGVGEHAARIRAQILDNMAWLGVQLDDDKNRAAVGTEARISGSGSAVDVWVIPADEQLELAMAALSILNNAEAQAKSPRACTNSGRARWS